MLLEPLTLKPDQLYEVRVHVLLMIRIQYVCFISHVRGNHWTGVAIDSVNLWTYYGDSMQAPIPDDLKAIEWWLSNHFTLPFTWSSLEITEQHDSYSCGLLAANALMHHIDPAIHPFIQPHPNVLDIAQLHWGNMIICAHVSGR